MATWEVKNGVLTSANPDLLPADPQDTVVDVTHAGICGSDWPKLQNPQGFQLPAPWRPGHEIVGTDTSGRAVAINPLVPCQVCTRCTEGGIHLCPSLRRVGWELPGGFATRVLVPAWNVHPLPEHMPMEHAVLADPMAVAIHGIRCHPFGPAGELAVIGAGPIGLLTALYAQTRRWRVTVVHRDDRRPTTAAADALDVTFQPASDLAIGVCGGFDAVVDAASGTAAAPLALSLSLLRDGGTVLVQNAYNPDVRLPSPVRDIFRRSIRLIGSSSYCRRHQPDDFATAIDVLREHPAVATALLHRAGSLPDLVRIISQTRPPSTRAVMTVRRRS